MYSRYTILSKKTSFLVWGFLMLGAWAFCVLPPELDPANYAPNAKSGVKLLPRKRQRPPETRTDDRPTTPIVNRPAPNVPLYLRFPPEQVVVGQIGDAYILTRRELTGMVGTPVSPGILAQRDSDPLIAQEIERKMDEAEGNVLYEWAVTKAFALLAKQKGVQVTEEELNARTKEASEGMPTGPSSGQGPTTALVVDPQVLRTEMRDGLMADKYIQQEVQRLVPEAGLRAIYQSNPARFMVPAQIHVWQIIRLVPPNASKEEISDLRKAFYKARKKAANGGGEDFEKVALEENPRNDGKPFNGDMGWVDAGSGLPPKLMEAVQSLKIGEVSEIIETTGGTESPMNLKVLSGRLAPSQTSTGSGGAFHVLRFTERREAKGATFDSFARQSVLDFLVLDFRKQYGDLIVKQAPFPILLNPTGLRLINEPLKKAAPPSSIANPIAGNPSGMPGSVNGMPGNVNELPGNSGGAPGNSAAGLGGVVPPGR